jgi:peroxiredoxin
MQATPFTCPGCGTEFRPSAAVAVTSEITCPLCGKTFPVPVAEEPILDAVEEIAEPAGAAPVAPAPGRERSDLPDDADELGKRLRRTPKTPPTPWAMILGVIALVVGMLAIVTVAVAVIVFPLWLGKKATPTAHRSAFVLPDAGQQAPSLVGNNLDGKVMRLSDHEGKVVVLLFWDGRCRELFPHYRKLVKRLEKEPFALVGVNEDPDPDAARREVQENHIPWPSWKDDPDKGSPLALRWGAQVVPTVFLIDHHGIVRNRFDGPTPDDQIDRAVDELVKKAKNEGQGK